MIRKDIQGNFFQSHAEIHTTGIINSENESNKIDIPDTDKSPNPLDGGGQLLGAPHTLLIHLHAYQKLGPFSPKCVFGLQ